MRRKVENSWTAYEASNSKVRKLQKQNNMPKLLEVRNMRVADGTTHESELDLNRNRDISKLCEMITTRHLVVPTIVCMKARFYLFLKRFFPLTYEEPF